MHARATDGLDEGEPCLPERHLAGRRPLVEPGESRDAQHDEQEEDGGGADHDAEPGVLDLFDEVDRRREQAREREEPEPGRRQTRRSDLHRLLELP